MADGWWLRAGRRLTQWSESLFFTRLFASTLLRVQRVSAGEVPFTSRLWASCCPWQWWAEWIRPLTCDCSSVVSRSLCTRLLSLTTSPQLHKLQVCYAPDTPLYMKKYLDTRLCYLSSYHSHSYWFAAQKLWCYLAGYFPHVGVQSVSLRLRMYLLFLHHFALMVLRGRPLDCVTSDGCFSTRHNIVDFSG